MADIREYTFIENIEEIVEKKLKELRLTPKVPLNLKKLKSDNRRFYFTPCQKNKKQMFFKMLVVQEEYPIYTLKKEIKATEFLSKAKPRKGKLYLPLFIDGDVVNYPYWFLDQFVPGKLAGYFYELHKPGLQKKVLKQIIDNLLALQSIPAKISINKRKFEWHVKEIEVRKGFLKNQKNIPFKKITAFVKSREKNFRAVKPVLAHGDYTLANFLLCKNKVYISDWEHMHLNNFAADISHLWSQTWRYPKWRKELLLYFLSNVPQAQLKHFEETFRAVALIEALGELAFSSELCPKKYKVPAKKAARQTIQAAFKDFNNLLNLHF